ncbi:hypothetical protein SAMN05444955_11746 [Lihuaxuella thermophila]|uniref:Uncharacterized protein n=2 Tax=Lihuaxuella thermophila TaxID=1173111 RepID=A0A1H8IEV4_9BACL|nr:hypothetical protein SAMN05444955_11746 [Lihuaxuella thermophila]
MIVITQQAQEVLQGHGLVIGEFVNRRVLIQQWMEMVYWMGANFHYFPQHQRFAGEIVAKLCQEITRGDWGEQEIYLFLENVHEFERVDELAELIRKGKKKSVHVIGLTQDLEWLHPTVRRAFEEHARIVRLDQ